MKRLRRFIPVALLAAACLATGAAWGDGGPTVLFDQSHGQKFLVGEAGRLQLSELAEIFRNQGFRVTSQTEPITDRVLAKCDALVLSGAFRPYTAEEVAVIGRFVERGGRLAVMLHTAPPLAGLLAEQLARRSATQRSRAAWSSASAAWRRGLTGSHSRPGSSH